MSEELNGFDGDMGDSDIARDQTGSKAIPAVAKSANQAAQVIPASSDNVVTLPDGQTIDSLDFDGRDLIIILADGTRIVVPDGAIIVPQIIVDGTPIPPANIAALLDGATDPTAGVNPSSGGNFATDPGAIQSAFDLGDLLPYTELPQNILLEEEIIPGLLDDEEPEIVILTPDNPVGVTDAIATVLEEGLPSRGSPSEPEGTDASSDGETTSGTIIFSAPDGLSAILINGKEITAVGQSFTSPFGTLTITSINLQSGEIGFSYTLQDNTLAEEFDGFFEATIVDTDGDEATATLQIRIIDDAPIGVDDTATVPGGDHDAVTGNVLDNDVSGADDFPTDGGVTGFSNESGSAAPGASLQGEYGVLTLEEDGSYSYARDVNTPGGVEETFSYDIVDQDGSISSAVLTIAIEDGPAVITSVPQTGEGTVVDEGGLPPRSGEPAGTGEIADDDPANDSDPSETTSATITFNSVDGLGSITINGVTVDQGNLPQTIVSDTTGTLVITAVTYDPLTGDGSISYEYTLADNTGGDGTSVTFEISVTDLDGDTATDDLTITIVDDEPEARDDTGTAGMDENAPIIVDVFANDTSGADDVAPEEIALVAGSLQGDGTVTYNGDGTFTYTPGPGEDGQVTFDYTITDGDGDVSTATVTITLADDSTPTLAVEGDSDVDEAGLPARSGEPEGSDAASDGEIALGTIAITTGGDTLASLVINGQDVTGGGTVVTAKGELVISVVAGEYSYAYTLTDNTLSDPDSDTFSLTVTDSDGSVASTSLVIAIVDDAPEATDDAAGLVAGEYGPVGGSVLVNDTQGADGAVVTAYTGTGGAGVTGETVQGTYGTLTIAADGTFSYTRDPGTPGGVTDTFNYVITDGDGDLANADLVITIANSLTTLDLPTAGDDGALVDEAGVESPFPGSAAAGDSEITSGTFTFTAPDGPAVVTIDGIAVTGPGQMFTGSFGTLTITSVANGVIGYTYELTTNTNGDATSDSFAVVVTDQDGDTSSGDLEIAIIDDEPVANPDADSVTEDGPLVASGNVITGTDIAAPDANGTDGVADVQGADSATVTGVAAGVVAGPVTGSVDTDVAGAYGTLSILADGSYVYTLNNADPTVQGLDQTETLTDVFTYTLTDGDGDTSTTTVTVTINGADDPVVLSGFSLQGVEQVVDEDDLADGSSPDPSALTQSGTFDLTSGDGLDTLSIGGTSIFGSGVTYPVTITGTYGTLTVTGVMTTLDPQGDVVAATVSYEYTLSDNTEAHLLAGEDSLTDSFAVVATDTDGSSDTNSLDIDIIDDVPTAVADTDSVTEGASTGGNVLTDTADTFGADGAEAAGGVVGVRAAGGDTVTDASGSVGVTIAGLYGTLTLDADGTYTYQSTAGAVSADAVDVFVYTIEDGDGDLSTTTLTIDVANVTLAPDNSAVTVDEAALDSVGSDPASTAETASGQLNVAGAVSYVLDSGSDTYGTLTLNADGSYSYTLTAPFDTSPDADDGTNTELGAESYGYTATDANGNSVTGTITVNIVDDVPTAVADTDSVTEGASTGGNVLTDTADTFGADGAEAAGGVVGVRAAGGDTVTDASGSVGVTIAGLYGTLTLDADGTYTYQSTAGAVSADAVDVFVYTIEDGDGDLSTTTLTIDVANVTLAPDNSAVTVDEAALDSVGSDPASTAETASGQLNVAGAVSYVLDSGSDTYGTLTLNADGSYSYTLTAPFDTSPDADDGTNTELGAESYGYTATDANGNSVTGTITVNIVDDVPTAVADTDSVTEGASTGGNVLTDTADTFGADGAEAAGGVVGVRAAGGDTVTDASGSVGVTIAGLYGTLTLDADGTYTYQSTAGAVSADAVDVFVYTIEDGDGDLSTTTLTIDVANVTLAPDNSAVTVDEAALDSVGSDPASTAETASGQLNVAGAVSYVLDSGSDTYGTLTLNADGSYSYTLTAPFDTSPDADDGTNTELGAESYGYTATDANGNSVTGTITVNIVDDVPTAVADTDSVTEGASTGGNVLTDTADTFGADGAEAAGGVVGVRAAGGDTVTDASGSVGVTIAGLYGTLTLDADGTYTYQSTAGAVSADAVDVFVYTIEDGDGDLSTTTLTIDVANVTLAPDNSAVTVDEAALDSVGSDPASTAETASGQLNVAGAVSYVLDSGSDTYGTLTLNADGSYSYTLTAPFDTSPDADDGTNTELGAESYGYTATDANGNSVTGTITVNIVDDVPTAVADTDSVTEGASTGGNVLTDTADTFGADGAEAAGGVVGVRAAGGDTVTDASGSVGVTIAGLYGTLTLDADGTYTYQSTAGAVSADAVDVFVYTIEDGDGDLSTTTLTIDVANVTLAPDNSAVTVDEAALDSVGSDPASTAETASGQLNVAGAVSYVLDSGSDTYGTLTLNADGSYSYTLTAPFDTSPDADDGTNTELGAESYGYTATDANGNSVTGTITVNIVDDVPTAVADTDSVTEGASTGGNVLTDTADTFGADGAEAAGGVVGVRAAGGDTVTDASGSVGVTIAGLYGTLTLDADGTYTYQSTAGAVSADAVDVFVYTIEDGDGDLSTTTLTIDVANVTLAPDNSAVTVDEAALDSVGSDPASTAETASGQLNVAGAVSYVLDSGSDTYGTLTLNADGSYSYTLTAPFDTSPDADDGTNTELGAESYGYTATDANGNSVTGTITVNIVDDVPFALAPAAAILTNTAGSMSALTTLDLTDGDVDNNYGADGPGAVIFTSASVTALESQNLTSGLAPLTYTISPDGTVITARTANENLDVFTIELQPAGANDQYKVTIIRPIDSVEDIDFNDGGYDFVGGNGSWAGFNLPGTSDSQDLLLTPVGGGTVNTNANEGGVSGGNSVGSGESMRVDYVTDLSGSPVSGGNFYGGDDTQNFDGHYTVNGGSAFFTKINSATQIKVRAFDDNDSGAVKNVGDGVQDTITSIGISFNGASVIVSNNGAVSVGGRVFIVIFNGDGTANVGNVGDGTRIAAFTADGFNSVEWQYVSGNTFKIGDFGATAITNDPVDFSVPISIRDGDGDIVDAGTLNITANPGTVPVLLDLDGDGVEFLGLGAGVAYDLDGDGILESTALVGADDGLLIHDANGDGNVSGASEFVFGGGSMTDLAAVAVLFDSNADGILDASDAAYAEFGVWQDADSDGIADAGEYTSLADLGIVSINLTGDGAGRVEAGGDVTVHANSTFTWADGRTGQLADVTLRLGAERVSDQAIASAAMAGFLAGMPVAAAAQDGNAPSAQYALNFDPSSAMPALTRVMDEAERDFAERSALEGQHQFENAAPHTAVQHIAATPSNPLGDGDAVRGSSDAAEHAADHGLEPAAFSFAGPDMSGMGMMEALLVLGEGQGASASADPSLAISEIAQGAIADALAGKTVDSLIEQFVGGQDDTPVEIGEAHASQLAELLSVNIDGHSMFTSLNGIEIAMDDGSELAVTHG